MDCARTASSSSKPSLERTLKFQVPEHRSCTASLARKGVGESVTRVRRRNLAPGSSPSLLAGFYEDPSAITKGWHANAVEFDHLLNQSSAAWAIGAPSVVPLFASGISHIRARAYDDAMEDFAASSDHAALD